MTDDEFLEAFMSCTLPAHAFRHRDHLRLAWLLVRRHGFDVAMAEVSASIRRFAAHHGQATKYHETMTQFWVRIVDHTVRTQPDMEDFDRFLEAFPMLLDSSLPFRHWQRETMFSPVARAEWVAPDVLSLPASVPD